MKIFYIFVNLLIIFKFSLTAACERYENGCIKCDPITNLCLKCEKEVLIPDTIGGCMGAKKCTLGHNFCEKCNSDYNHCEICEEGYYQDNNGGCSYTKNCEISSNGDCLKCKENHILIGVREYYDTLKICKSLSSSDLKNCISVDLTDGFCLKCKEGYNITSGDKKCTNTENCFEMENGECSSCVENYYYDKKQKKCIEIDDRRFYNCKSSSNGEICSKCQENFFLSDDFSCVDTNYCSKSEKNICIKCKEGFYLTKKGQCSKSDNCFEADPKNGICIKCDNNFYLDLNDRQCIPYSKDENYKYCSKYKNNCFQCVEGYYLAKNNLCSSARNCTFASEDKCTECENGLYLTKDFKCVKDKLCIYTNDKNECIECQDNYYYDKLSQACISVESDTFKNCKYSDILGEKCEFCKGDYYINLSDNLCYSNKQKGPLYKCAISETGKNCTKCEKDFYLGFGDRQCSSVEGCYRSNENNECQECEEDYCLNKKTSLCEWNFLIEDESQKIFFKCKMTNSDATACISCEDRFKVGKEGVCVNMVDCDKSIDGKCTKCKNVDEEGNYHCLNPLFGCVETYTSNCTKCNDNLDTLTHCDECEEGYRIDGNSNCVLIEKEDH